MYKIETKILFIAIFFCCILSLTVYADRAHPAKVDSVVFEGIRYEAPHKKMGYVEAWDTKTEKKLWEKKIYDIKIDSNIEQDTQWVFITDLSIEDNKLIVVNEKNKRYEVDLQNMKIENSTSKKLFFWIVDLIIPVTMIIIGLFYKKHAPKEINKLHGYRTIQSMKSQEAWDYAQKHFSKLWLYIGVLLGICIIISKLISPISPEYLSLIHAGIGIVALIIPVPCTEIHLKRKVHN